MPLEISPSNPSPRPSAPDLVAELQDSAAFREFRAGFAEALLLPLALRAPGSFAAPPLGDRRASRFCVLLAGRNGSCSACLRFQQQVAGLAGSAGATASCPAGLVESAVPVTVDGRVVAHLWTGQVRLGRASAGEVAAAAAGAAAAGLDAQAAAQAYRATTVIEPHRYEAALRLLRIFSAHLAAVATRSLRRSEALRIERPEIARARAFARAHLTEPISLGAAARAVGLSRFHFCKLFRRATGTGFRDYVATLRVEAARRLLADPRTLVCEAAYAVGFRSLSQCKRSFVRLTGRPPSAHRLRASAAAR